MSQNKGFTLIELLVVIAIIGILAAAALASLGAARQKGQEAAVKSQMANMRAQAELYFSTTGAQSYGDGLTAANTFEACPTSGTTMFAAAATSNGLASLISGATTSYSSAAPKCVTDTAAGTNATKWAVAAALPTGTFYCVDSSGYSGSVASTSPTTTTAQCQ